MSVADGLGVTDRDAVRELDKLMLGLNEGLLLVLLVMDSELDGDAEEVSDNEPVGDVDTVGDSVAVCATSGNVTLSSTTSQPSPARSCSMVRNMPGLQVS